MRFTIALAALAMLATGCKKDASTETEETNNPTPPTPPTVDTGDTGGEDCGDTNPVLSGVVAENTSAAEVEMTFNLTTSDADGDLHNLYFDLWIDDVVDGSVDTSGPAPLTGGPAQVVDQNGNPVSPCTVEGQLGLGVVVGIDGTNIPYDTELDFAWRIRDAAENPSNVVVASAFTPKADGSDGGVVDPPDPTGDTGTPPDPTGDTGTPPDPTGDSGMPTTTADTGSTAETGHTGDTGN